MELNREKLKRMFEDTKGNGGSANGGGGGGSLAGYATQAWVNEGFVSIEFFNRLFTVYGPGETSSDPDVVIEPNDLDSTIKNIKAMFGLWTEQYLSALGLNPGGTGSATSLGMLDDVDITTPTNGQALIYNATSLKWENQTISTVTALANLTDVLLTSPSTNQVLVYDGAKWINTSLKTINYQSIIGSGDIQVGGGASGNYLPLTGGTLQSNRDDWNLIIKQSYSSSHSSVYLANANGSALWAGGSSSNQGRYIAMFRRGTASFGSGGEPVLCIMDNGSVGINKENAQYNLDVMSNMRARLLYFLDSTNNSTAGFLGRGSSDNTIHFIGDSDLCLGANGSWLVYLKTRKIGIIKSDPNYTLDIEGSTDWAQHISNTNSYCFTCNNDGFGMWLGVKGTSGYIFRALGNVSGDGSGGNDVLYVGANGNVGVGTSSPSYTLHVSGSIYATGAITALSDIKQKNIKEYMQLGIDEVANAPVIKFTWKDPKVEDKGLQVGSIAQYWEKVLPEAVKRDKEGTLSMSYGVVALVAAISTAKKVQEHERRIADLECENKKLKGQLIRLNRYGKQ